MISCTYTACDHEKIPVNHVGHPHCIWDNCKNGYIHCRFDHRQSPVAPEVPAADLYTVLADYSTPGELIKLGLSWNLIRSKGMPEPAFKRGKFKLYHTATVMRLLENRTQKHWTTGEVGLLLQLKKEGKSWTFITAKLGRSYASCQNKYREVR